MIWASFLYTDVYRRPRARRFRVNEVHVLMITHASDSFQKRFHDAGISCQSFFHYECKHCCMFTVPHKRLRVWLHFSDRNVTSLRDALLWFGEVRIGAWRFRVQSISRLWCAKYETWPRNKAAVSSRSSATHRLLLTFCHRRVCCADSGVLPVSQNQQRLQAVFKNKQHRR